MPEFIHRGLIIMTGKTHLTAGTAAALCLLRPDSPGKWVVCTAAAAVGAVICDVDVSTSDSRETLNQITALTLLSVLAVCLAEFWFHLGILRNFNRESSWFRLISGFLALLVLCSWGKTRPHRSFMHSLPCLVLLSGIIGYIYPALVPGFFIGMGSHIVLDLLNYKGVRLLYPLKFKLSFSLCSSHGLVNRMIAKCGAGIFSLVSFILFLSYVLTPLAARKGF
ncbi:MAG TPA: metal-dependent hydrolase [Candidatus Cottocaccamicrobium excrementipullorum]|nr:metal-dependent hydrolase [Candidatus Cottocaccamicrobium excrementipullorum]